MKKLLILCNLIAILGIIFLVPWTGNAQSCSTVTLCTQGSLKMSGKGSITITVNTATPTITSGQPPNAQTAVPYTFPVTASGGATPYIFTCTGCSATGLNLTQDNVTGIITGTPTVVASYPVTFNVVDANNQTAPPQNWTISVSGAPPALAITSAPLPAGQVGLNYLCSGLPCLSTANGGAPPYVWSLFQPTQPLGYEDMLNWMLPDLATRNANYFIGNAERKYSFLDGNSTPGTFWWVKDATGHPWDIQLYDNYNTYLWITENGDQGAFTNPTAYKRFILSKGNHTEQGVPFSPRYFNPGSTVTYLSAKPNYIKRTLNCEADNQPLIDIGDVKTVTTGPTNVAWGGSIGTQPTLVVSYYYSGNAGVYNDLEQFSLVKNFGQVQWQHFTWNGSIYVLQQTSTFINKVAGTTSISFPCSAGATWYPPQNNSILPPGLALNSGTGAVTGTPTTQGTFTPTLQVADNAAATATQVQSIPISSACSVSISPLSSNVTVGGTLQVTATTTGCTPSGAIISVNGVPNGLPLGTMTSVAGISCPAGFDAGSICSQGTITSCPGVANATVTWGVESPVGTPKGTIFVHSGGDGTVPSTSPTNALYVSNGYTVVTQKWSSQWEDTGLPAKNLGAAACKPATLFDYIMKNVATATGGKCIEGVSGGSAAAGYALSWYGAGQYLDKVQEVDGPVFGDIQLGCEVPNPPLATVCSPGQFGCASGGNFSDLLSYSGGTGIDAITGSPIGTCNNGTTTSSQQNLAWKLQSVVDGTTNRAYNFPQTSVSGWVCDNGLNNSASQGNTWFTQFNSLSTTHNFIVYPVHSCTGAEGVDSGTVLGGIATPTQMVTDVNDAVNGCKAQPRPNGTINNSGLYTAPATVPNPSTVTITAKAIADNTKTAVATITILGNQTGSCGPPAYTCSNSTSTVTPTITSLFTGTTGVNQIKYDTTLNPSGTNPIVRATDSTTAGGNSLNVPHSQNANDNVWSKDDSMFAIADAHSNTTYIVGFDPTAMQVTNPGALTNLPNAGGSITFSRTTPKIAYSTKQATDGIWKTTFTTPSSFTQTKIFDLTSTTTCPGLIAENFIGMVTSSSAEPISISADDNIILLAWRSNNQNSNAAIIAYRQSDGKCSVYFPYNGHTYTWGSSTSIQGNSGCLFRSHASLIFIGGLWAENSHGGEISGCSTNGGLTTHTFWQIGTNNTIECTDGIKCQGHEGIQSSHMPINNDPKWYNLSASDMFTSYPNFFTWPTGVVADAHISGDNADPNDTYPPIITVACDAIGNCLGAPNNFGAPLENEIISLFPNSTYANGRSWVRFFHNFNTTLAYPQCTGGEYFPDQYGIGVVSQSGKFFSWTSDMLCGLGIDVQSKARMDVFVGALDNQFTSGGPTNPTITSITPNTGTVNGGTSVTVTGTNFTSPATVSFGSAFATSSVVVNSTTITCITPAGTAGAVNVTVTDTTGNLSGTLVNGYTYTQPSGQIAIYPPGPITVEQNTKQPFSPWVNNGLGTQTVTWSLVSGVGSIDTNGIYTSPNSTGSAVIKAISTATGDSITASITVSGTIPSFTLPAGTDGGGTMQHDGVKRTFYLHQPTHFSTGNSGLLIQLPGIDGVGQNTCVGGTSAQEAFFWSTYLDAVSTNAPLLICPNNLYYLNAQATACHGRWNIPEDDQTHFYGLDATCKTSATAPNDNDYVYQLILMAINQYGINPKKIWVNGNWHDGAGMALSFAIAHPEIVAAIGYYEHNPPLRIFGCGAFPSPPVTPTSIVEVKGTNGVDPFKACGSNNVTCSAGTPGDLDPQSSLDDEMNYGLPWIGNPGTVGGPFCSGGDGSSFLGTLERHSNLGILGTQIQQFTLVKGTNVTYCPLVGGCPGGQAYVDFTQCGSGSSTCPTNTSLTTQTGKDMDSLFYNFFIAHVKP